MRPLVFILGVLGAVTFAACDTPPIDWTDPVAVPAEQGKGNRLVVDTAGNARFVTDSSAEVSINVPGVCPASIRTARGATSFRAVWWGVRPDSNAVLFMAVSRDSGKTWGAPIAVDTADVGGSGCRRPPPAVAAVGEDLHIAYSMKAAEGTGVFFAHYLASMVHSPVAVIYGDRLVPTAIAAEGDRVVVAYEDPNGTRRQVAVALSTTQGHIFEQHATASRDVDVATNPAVAIAGRYIAVAWSAPQAADTDGRRIVRRGRIH